VRWEGNVKAQAMLAQVFTPFDADWRGIGTLPGSGLKIAEAFAAYDAELAIPVVVEELREHQGCLCGEILKGKVSPFDCPLFGKSCTPESPVGACMVSSEGTCAAAYKYAR
jgi:hydrogenase expression/formation protein HypD